MTDELKEFLNLLGMICGADTLAMLLSDLRYMKDPYINLKKYGITIDQIDAWIEILKKYI